ncbi:MAG: Holliday junction resolvase RuvX [Clostridia bacterium]|nr:Holliday junction resolvase RuvX [Clostridia bacterium]
MAVVIGVDCGDVRSGLAVSDPLGLFASGIGTVRANGLKNLADIIIAAAEEKGAETIVLGDPVNMDGSRGERSRKIHALRDIIAEKTDIPAVLFDERCTTMQAARYLNETDTRGKKRKNVIDALSAEIILQDYLDSLKNGKR